ncbi:hypothetical protein CAPTEDRAFT_195984 [Capitella teleta]|uniref:Endonuclease/exonuclease/phosphatase domain-containing protein n=1 Tax=Capitella teleta TaxID=283909 RepID=R7UFG0_CAPTE|nr:hypothetical protein CAPTEDRAFT_195984 [Capitella teleta]|eukprot:ELU05279.1 hypothetical protein CAPTEDRAFT_195984 [Capitella teleta]
MQQPDFLCLQETWLINETAGLIAVDTDYLHVHKSGMDSRQEVIMGRSKGGIVIRYRSDFGKKVSHVDVPSSRACAVVLTENSLRTMLLCVYMPCNNYSTSVVDPEFDDVLNCIDTIMYANPCHEYVVCGDFNVSFTRNNAHSRRLEEFLQWHGLSKCWDSPISNMSNTYQNFSLNQFSCIDHICLSNRVFSSIESCEVISDLTNPSNHSALDVKVCQQGVLKLTKEGQAARVNACLDSGLECIPAKKPAAYEYDTVSLNGHAIQWVESVCHLGNMIDTKLTHQGNCAAKRNHEVYAWNTGLLIAITLDKVTVKV